MEILEKLKQLEENIGVLQELKETLSIESINNHKRYEWELRYGLFESIQIMIDISCKITNHFNLGNPQNYRGCIELLGRFNYLDKDFLQTYINMIGLRNLLIHEYAEIDAEKLYIFLDSIDDFKSFIKQISTNMSI